MAKKKVEINRKKYNEIRKMDHYSLEQCIAGYYEQGYAAGLEEGERAAPAFNAEKALASIMRIKGIGAVKIAAIQKAMAAAGAKDLSDQLEGMLKAVKEQEARRK